VFAFLNTYVFKDYVPTVHLDTTMIATVIDVFANLASSREEDSVILFVLVIKPT